MKDYIYFFHFQNAVTRIITLANLPGPGYPVYRLPIIAACEELLAGRGVDGGLVCVGMCDNYGPHVRKTIANKHQFAIFSE